MNPSPVVPMLIAAALASGSAAADAIVSFEIEAPGYQETQVAHIGQGMVSVRNPGGAQSTDAVYDRNADQVVLIEHDQRSYMILDESRIEEFAGQAQGIAAMIQAQLENVTPEQRAQMEQMMANMGLDGMVKEKSAPPEMRYVDTGESRTVGGYPCAVYRVLQNDVPSTEMCVATRETLELPRDDYDTLRSMHRFYQRLATKAEALIGDLGGSFPDLAAEQIDGLPIFVHDINEGVTVTLAQIDLADVDPQQFKVPEGYAEAQLPSIGQ